MKGTNYIENIRKNIDRFFLLVVMKENVYLIIFMNIFDINYYIIILVFIFSENFILISDGSDLKQGFYAGGGIRARDLSIMSRTL